MSIDSVFFLFRIFLFIFWRIGELYNLYQHNIDIQIYWTYCVWNGYISRLDVYCRRTEWASKWANEWMDVVWYRNNFKRHTSFFHLFNLSTITGYVAYYFDFCAMDFDMRPQYFYLCYIWDAWIAASTYYQRAKKRKREREIKMICAHPALMA